MYWAPGVIGGDVALRSIPRSARCVGVKSMSETSAFDLIAGKAARKILYINRQLNRRRA